MFDKSEHELNKKVDITMLMTQRSTASCTAWSVNNILKLLYSRGTMISSVESFHFHGQHSFLSFVYAGSMRVVSFSDLQFARFHCLLQAL